MNKRLRKLHLEILNLFSKNPGNFALAGGTALEIFYLQHRFSRDLDFFSLEFNYGEIVSILEEIKKGGYKPEFKDEITHPGKMNVHFYTIPIEKTSESLKLDFVEDVLPQLTRENFIKKIKGIPVYDVNRIYFQKIIAITGIVPEKNGHGEPQAVGRNVPRDVIDLYYLSKKIEPLHSFLKTIPRTYQRTMIGWRKRFSTQKFEQDYLDYADAIYDRKLKSKMIIRHLDDELSAFLEGELS
ncbi:nucleotidyl transferase AbiEii/AbiGii toxin family protein [bacterium]|nr:nucleotidyl transferase AbiEii/AbiGii toxin family protein [bacterium]